MKAFVISLLVVFIVLHVSILVCKIDTLNVDASVITDLKKVNIAIGVLLWVSVLFGLIRGDLKFPDMLRKRKA